ncbi:MAG: bifunctional (p)ppGpp synthetase/guanosine-3',5'-bis(diphosphate) 3'-pyrophosphohydrolase, partial [Clostridia bacterium]|nr:bifunctional (p)ppGpp synthetase/guanosine-3',5'-bis(diphosphate) 3'-pyrophosphohydrolase [Clostridia bacterium]
MSDTMKKEFLEIRAIMEKNCNPEDLILIDKAYELAVKAHEGQKRLSGEDYVSHPISVARILANMGMDASSVIAALLHDTVEDTDVSIETVMQDFGTDIALLVDGVTKLGKVPLSTKEEVQAENLRKMLLAMN